MPLMFPNGSACLDESDPRGVRILHLPYHGTNGTRGRSSSVTTLDLIINNHSPIVHPLHSHLVDFHELGNGVIAAGLLHNRGKEQQEKQAAAGATSLMEIHSADDTACAQAELTYGPRNDEEKMNSMNWACSFNATRDQATLNFGKHVHFHHLSLLYLSRAAAAP